jgi:hypothetical protein
MPPGQRPIGLRPSPAPSEPSAAAPRIDRPAPPHHRAAQDIAAQRVQIIRGSWR